MKNSRRQEALARESLATRQRLFGNDNLEAAGDSLRTLVVIMGDKEQWAEAEGMMRKVLELRRKKLGPEHPSVASALNDVALGRGRQWETKKEAEANLQEQGESPRNEAKASFARASGRGRFPSTVSAIAYGNSQGT